MHRQPAQALAIDGGGRDLQYRRSAGDTAITGADDTLDRLAFDHPQRAQRGLAVLRRVVVDRRAMRRAGGQVQHVGRQHLTIIEDDGAPQRVFQLSHVAGPVMGQQLTLGACTESCEALAFVACHAPQQPGGDLQDILTALAQRRHLQWNDVQAIEEVFPEAVGIDQYPRVLMRGAHDAAIDLYRARGTHRHYLSCLQEAQQLALQG